MKRCGALSLTVLLFAASLPAAAPVPLAPAVPTPEVVVPTSQTTPQKWRYTTKWPGKGWFKEDYDDSKWQEGPGGFGTNGTPGAVVRTEWNKSRIWVRRSFDLPKGPGEGLRLLIHHDEDAWVYINGVEATKLRGYVTDYVEVPIEPKALAALRPGKNVIAIYCRQTVGGQFVDAGLVRVPPAPK